MLNTHQVETCVRYVLRVLLDGIPGNWERAVAYAPADAPLKEEVRVRIVPGGFFERYGTLESLPKTELPTIDDVPLLFGEPRVESQGGCLTVHADIIASAYFLLTRYEETVRRDIRDSHGRFPGRESLAVRAGFVDRPLVDEYAALLRGWLNQNGALPEPKRQFSVILTHDVDSMRKFRGVGRTLRVMANALLGKQPFNSLINGPMVLAGLKRDPYDCFDDLMGFDALLADSSIPAKVIYFFMSGGKPPKDMRYPIQGKAARELLRSVLDAGAEVGLHASYEAGGNPDLIPAEKAALEAVAGGKIYWNRHHYLRWREPEHGSRVAGAGFQHDSTMGFADSAGFRLGVCRPVQLFDPVTIQPLNLIEHPLILMDGTLSDRDYMRLDRHSALRHCLHLLERTRAHNGEFVVLWHNNVFEPTADNYHPWLYPTLLGAIRGDSTMQMGN